MSGVAHWQAVLMSFSPSPPQQFLSSLPPRVPKSDCMWVCHQLIKKTTFLTSSTLAISSTYVPSFSIPRWPLMSLTAAATISEHLTVITSSYLPLFGSLFGPYQSQMQFWSITVSLSFCSIIQMPRISLRTRRTFQFSPQFRSPKTDSQCTV